MAFTQITPHSSGFHYDGFRYDGHFLSFTKSLTDYIINFEYAYITIDEDSKAFQIGFSKEKLDGSFSIKYSGAAARITIGSRKMPHGRYVQADDNKSIYTYSK